MLHILALVCVFFIFAILMAFLQAILKKGSASIFGVIPVIFAGSITYLLYYYNVI